MWYNCNKRRRDMNTHETYVSLETAKLLKQLGFDWPCLEVWNDEKLTTWYEPKTNTWWNNLEVVYSAPTLAIAQKWIRDITDYQVEAICVYKEHKKKYSYAVYLGEYNNEILEEDFDSYELALEAGIKKCLEMILTKQQ